MKWSESLAEDVRVYVVYMGCNLGDSILRTAKTLDIL